MRIGEDEGKGIPVTVVDDAGEESSGRAAALGARPRPVVTDGAGGARR